MAVRYGDPSPIFGTGNDLPVEVPPGVVRWKLRQRLTSFAMLYLKYPDRIEEWLVHEVDGKIAPYMRRGQNKRNNA